MRKRLDVLSALKSKARSSPTRGVKPNPPYLATVVIAVVLMVIGLSLQGSLFSVAPLNQVVADALATVGVKASQEIVDRVIEGT